MNSMNGGRNDPTSNKKEKQERRGCTPMVFDGDPRSFMYYKEQYYINGTVVEISESYRNTNSFNGKKIWKYARFDRQISSPNGILYFFCITNSDTLSLRSMNIDRHTINEYASYFTVPAWMIENVIKTIIKPIKLSHAECKVINDYILNAIENPKSDFEYQNLKIGWIVYIGVLIASLIFKQFYLIWIIATFVFFKWRRGVLK